MSQRFLCSQKRNFSRRRYIGHIIPQYTPIVKLTTDMTLPNVSDFNNGGLLGFLHYSSDPTEISFLAT